MHVAFEEGIQNIFCMVLSGGSIGFCPPFYDLSTILLIDISKGLVKKSPLPDQRTNAAVTRIRTWVTSATTKGTNHYTITANCGAEKVIVMHDIK